MATSHTHRHQQYKANETGKEGGPATGHETNLHGVSWSGVVCHANANAKRDDGGALLFCWKGPEGLGTYHLVLSMLTGGLEKKNNKNETLPIRRCLAGLLSGSVIP